MSSLSPGSVPEAGGSGYRGSEAGETPGEAIAAAPINQATPVTATEAIVAQVVAEAAAAELEPERPRLTREQMLATCERGIDLCRFGSLKEGFATLASLGDISRAKEIPSAYFSFMGLGFAKYRNQIPQGIKLCRHAIKLEFFHTEHYVNLARVCMLQERYRRDAVDAVKEGQRIDPESAELIELAAILGERKRPVLTFLGRQNVLNQALGWIRHRLTTRQSAPIVAAPPPPTRRTRGSAVVAL